MPSFIEELKKRKVFNSAAIYLATAFILLQAVTIIIPALKIPEWTISFLVVIAILGFPVIIIISWIYDISDEGFVKTETESDIEPSGMQKSSMIGILTTIIITIFIKPISQEERKKENPNVPVSEHLYKILKENISEIKSYAKLRNCFLKIEGCVLGQNTTF